MNYWDSDEQKQRSSCSTPGAEGTGKLNDRVFAKIDEIPFDRVSMIFAY